MLKIVICLRQTYPTSDYKTFEDAFEALMAEPIYRESPPESAALACAGEPLLTTILICTDAVLCTDACICTDADVCTDTPTFISKGRLVCEPWRNSSISLLHSTT